MSRSRSAPASPAKRQSQDTLLRQRLAAILQADPRRSKDLAALAGISTSIISSINVGSRADLRAETVTRLARVLGLSAAELGKLLYECHPEK